MRSSAIVEGFRVSFLFDFFWQCGNVAMWQCVSVFCFCRSLCLQAVAEKIQKQQCLQPPMTRLMLQPDDWRVTQFLSHCQAATAKRGLGEWATLEESLKHKLQTGEGWKACFQRAEKVREQLAKELGKEAGWERHGNDRWTSSAVSFRYFNIYCYLLTVVLI